MSPGWVTVATFYAKTSKVNFAFTPLDGLLFNCPNWIPYLPAKDELVSLDRLSSWGLGKWYNSKGFGPATIWRGVAFHVLAVFSKMKILWKLWLWFSKMFHQRVLSDWKWSISKFRFWRRILDIYRQPLLSYQLLPPDACLNKAGIWILKFLFVSFENEGWRINFFICTFKPEGSKFYWLLWRRIQKSLILRGWGVNEEWNVRNWWFKHNEIPIILKLIIVPRAEFCAESKKIIMRKDCFRANSPCCELLTMTTRRPFWCSKTRNGGQENQPCGNQTFFLCKNFLL